MMIFRSKAPLRLGLAGGGTDVSPYCDDFGGMVLNATISMYAYCTLEVLSTNEVIFEALDIGQTFRIESLSSIEPDGSLDLHKGVYNRIVSQFNGGKPLSVRISTYSDAPPGSGLGSSSTMVVAMIKAYTEWLNLPLGEYDVAHLAFEIERIELGLSGGKQDQYAATFGGFNFMEFSQGDKVIVNPLRVKRWISNELEASMILYYTGASRESAKIIDEQAANVRERKEKPMAAMHVLKDDAIEMKEAILRGEIARFAGILGRSWEAKKRLACSITNPMIDAAFNAAMGAGAIAGKVSGAGGGGFIMFVVDPRRRLNVIRTLEEMPGQVVSFQFVSKGTMGWRI